MSVTHILDRSINDCLLWSKNSFVLEKTFPTVKAQPNFKGLSLNPFKKRELRPDRPDFYFYVVEEREKLWLPSLL